MDDRGKGRFAVDVAHPTRELGVPHKRVSSNEFLVGTSPVDCDTRISTYVQKDKVIPPHRLPR